MKSHRGIEDDQSNIGPIRPAGRKLMMSCQMANRIAMGQIAEPSEDDFAKLVSCLNYTEGVGVGFLAGGNGGGATGQPRLCLPHGTTVGQRAQVFTLWAEQHPEAWNSPAFVGVISALQAQWPCSATG
jgi:hypothetical protein